MNLNERLVQTNGIDLQCLTVPGASGKPVVMLHGNTHCGGIWAPLMQRLAERGFEPYGVSLRGHGRSTKAESGYEWTNLKEDTRGLLDALDIERALFVAHSRGGGVSLMTGLYYPERVRGIVAYEPTSPLRRGDGPSPNMRPTPPAQLMERTERRRTNFPSREFLFDYYRARDTFKAWRDEYLWAYIDYGHELVEDGIERLCPGWVEGKMYEAMGDDTAWRGRTSATPLLLVFGDNGGRLGPGRDPLGLIQTVYPGANANVMKDSSHFGPMEHPEVFERLVLDFEEGLSD